MRLLVLNQTYLLMFGFGVLPLLLAVTVPLSSSGGALARALGSITGSEGTEKSEASSSSGGVK